MIQQSRKKRGFRLLQTVALLAGIIALKACVYWPFSPSDGSRATVDNQSWSQTTSQEADKSNQKAGKTAFIPPVQLAICSGARSFLPTKRKGLLISAYRPVVRVKGVSLYAAPVEAACLMRGVAPYARRYEGRHAGLDLSHRKGGKVYAAGDGIVRQLRVGRNYGKYVLIQHAGEVLSRYAHLDSIEKRIKVGRRIRAGEVLGYMGNTGLNKRGQRIGVHLHYEILIGKCNGENCFNRGNMSPVNPFDVKYAAR